MLGIKIEDNGKKEIEELEEQAVDNSKRTPYQDIYTEIKETLLLSRHQAYSAVNFAMVQAYWQIGRIIVEHEQKGNLRAEYGKAILQEILFSVSKYERTAFTIDMDTLSFAFAY